MIEGWQWIFLALIALVRVGGFVEASAFKVYRPSVWRWLGALYGVPHIFWKD